MIRMTRRFAMIGLSAALLLSGTALVPPAAPAAPLPPALSLGAVPSPIVQSRAGSFAIGPHIVHPGGTFTATFSPVPGFNDTFNLATSGFPGTPDAGCVAQVTSCTFTVPLTATTRQYQLYSVNFNTVQGFAFSNDYLAIAAGNVLTGSVTKNGSPVQAALLDLGFESATTDATGAYAVILAPGTYTVSVGTTPDGKGAPDVTACSGGSAADECTVDLHTGDGVASFAEAGLKVTGVTATVTGGRSGPTGGGTAITITGTGFGTAGSTDQVQLVPTSGGGASIAATSVVVVSDTTITAVTGNAIASLQTGQSRLVTDVEVTAGGQTSAADPSADSFTYGLAEVDSVFADSSFSNQASIVGGYTVSVLGFGFTGATQVAFGLNGNIVKTITVAPQSDGKITFTAPSMSALAGDIPGGQDVLVVDVQVGTPDAAAPGGFDYTDTEPNDHFQFSLPQVTSVVASSTHANNGSIAGGYQMTITGSGFDTGGTVFPDVDFSPVGSSAAPLRSVVAAVPTSDTQIVVTAPSLSDFADASDLVADVHVDIPDPNATTADKYVHSRVNGSDEFVFQLPQVSSVVDQVTKTNKVTINGRDLLTVTGAGFATPRAGVQDQVEFSFDGTVVKTVPVTPDSESSIVVGAPDLTALVGDIPSGQSFITIDVQVVVSDITGTTQARLESATTTSDEVKFFVPTVTSVIDQKTKVNKVTINGLDPIVVKGSGFSLENITDVDNVLFELDGSVVKTVPVVPASDSEIDVTAPDLIALVGDIPPGSNFLTVDVVVQVHDDGSGSFVTLNSPVTTDDQLKFFMPTVTSVESFTTHTNKTSILGDDLLTVNGSGFAEQDPSIADNVLFEVNGSVVSTVAVDPTSDSVITLSAPDLASLIDQIPAGGDALTVDVVVQVFDSSGVATTTLDSPITADDQLLFTVGSGEDAPPCNALEKCLRATSSDPNGSAVATSTEPTGSVTATGHGAGGVTVGRYPSDPVGAPTFSAAGSFFDVAVSSPNSFSSVTIQDCDLQGGTTAQWWNPAANGGAGAWQAVSPAVLSAGPPACLTITVNATSSPTLAQLTGTVFATVLPPTKLSILALPVHVPAGLPVPYLATVSKATRSGALTGTVSFTANGAPIPRCSRLRVILGLALCVTSFPKGGSYTVVATYSGDAAFGSSSASFTQLVYQAPVITSASHLSAPVGTHFSFQVTATGSPAPGFSETGALPKGVTLSSAGVLSGTPASKGNYVVTFVATSAAGTFRQRFTLST